MEKILFFSHGDKGGVGKSVISTLATEYLLNLGPVALVETDPRQPDVAKRYKGDPGIVLSGISLNRAGDSENALTRFGNWLEESRQEKVVVNLPSGAGETLDEHSHLIRSLADSLGYRLIVTYALEKNSVATEMMIRSLGSGLLSAVEPENRFAAYPLFKGDPESFTWYTSEQREGAEIGEIAIPALRNSSALQKLEQTTGRISGLISDRPRPEGWFIIELASLDRWYKSALQEMEKVFGKEGE